MWIPDRLTIKWKECLLFNFLLDIRVFNCILFNCMFLVLEVLGSRTVYWASYALLFTGTVEYLFSFRGARQPDRLLSVLRSFIHRHRRASVFWHRWVRPIAALAPLRLGFGSIEGRRTCTFSRSLLVPRGPQRWGRDRSSALVSLKGVRYDGVKDSEVITVYFIVFYLIVCF